MITAGSISTPLPPEFSSDIPAHIVASVTDWHFRITPHVWRPPTDVYDSHDEIMIRVEIAGMNNQDFSISFNQNILSISGVRSDSSIKKAYYQMEIPFGEFKTEIEINIPIDIEKIEARYKDGFLIITLPKAQSRQIQIG